MVMPINKFFKSMPGQQLEEAYLKSASQWAQDWMKSDDEGTCQKGRRVEGAIQKIKELTDEFEDLSRIVKGALETPVTEFCISFGKEQLQMDKLTGVKTCQFVIDMLDAAMRNNRIHYMEAHISLLKNVR